MTESEWLASTDPAAMLRHLVGDETHHAAAPHYGGHPGASARKLRLFAVNWWRQATPHSRAHEVLAKTLEDEANQPSLDRKVTATMLVWGTTLYTQPHMPGIGAALLREIVGNPFRPRNPYKSVHMVAMGSDHGSRLIPREPGLTPTVLGLAQAAYDERAFDRLPILADALEEAGCEDGGILDHLRGPGPHVRGCWVVDLLLGKY